MSEENDRIEGMDFYEDEEKRDKPVSCRHATVQPS